MVHEAARGLPDPGPGCRSGAKSWGIAPSWLWVTGRGGDSTWEDGSSWEGPKLTLPKPKAHTCLVPLLPPSMQARGLLLPLGVQETLPLSPAQPCPNKARQRAEEVVREIFSKRCRERRFGENTASVSLSVKWGCARAGSNVTQETGAPEAEWGPLPSAGAERS